jgi:hypothetical protein
LALALLNNTSNSYNIPSSKMTDATKTPAHDIEALPSAGQPVATSVVTKKASSKWKWMGVGAAAVLFVLLSYIAIKSLKTNGPDDEPNRQKGMQVNADLPLSPFPSHVPSMAPSTRPSVRLTPSPTVDPTSYPSRAPSQSPTIRLSRSPTGVPTAYPSGTPSAPPTSMPSASPSGNPTEAPTRFKQCGMTLSEVSENLKETEDSLIDSFRDSLEGYLTEYQPPAGFGDRRRQLGPWSQKSPWKKFLKIWKVGNSLFGTATNIFSFVDAIENRISDAKYQKEVLSRLDEIDAKVNLVLERLEDGFRDMKDFINEKEATALLDDIRDSLSSLKLGYEQYRIPTGNRKHQQYYREEFRGVCRDNTKSPIKTFAKLYSMTCSKCDIFDDEVSDDIIQVFIDKARDEFPDDEEGRLWLFRNMLGGFIISSMFETMFFHTACPYTLEPACNAEIEGWVKRMTKMLLGIEESIKNLLVRETELWDSAMPSMAPSMAPQRRIKLPWWCLFTKRC